MGIRRYKPTSPGRRGATVSDFAELTPGARPVKKLLRKVTSSAGRNNQGKITARHRGGGHKRRYRVIDFHRNKDGVPAKVASIQYDPNRSARIALLHYMDGDKRFMLAPDGLQAGAQVESGPEAPPNVGNCLPLDKIPLGTEIHGIEMRPGRGAVMCRSAGARATLVAREAAPCRTPKWGRYRPDLFAGRNSGCRTGECTVFAYLSDRLPSLVDAVRSVGAQPG